VIDLQHKKIPIVWTIAASDCSAGTGIQSDLLTFHDFKVYGCSVITALNAQTSFALGSSVATERKSVIAQINALDSDLPASAIKLGMLPNAELVETVAKFLVEDYKGLVVYDPDLANGSDDLLSECGDLLRSRLLPRVDLLVVNVEEAVALSAQAIDSPATMQAAAEKLLQIGARQVLITGASFSPSDNHRYDYWASPKQYGWITIDVLPTVNNRGGGSVLSAAITAALANAMSVEQAIPLAKAYVTQGIRGSLQLGNGPGAVAHLGLPENEDDMPQLSATAPQL
jgi:hydroxymethylpyrimidine kinase/phosphomethylpyrimidine kinase/thiamine-phosphate diphosphorylase